MFLADPDEMKARFIPVKTGIIDGDWVEILQPELNGMVVTLGQHLLENGASISFSIQEEEKGTDTSDADISNTMKFNSHGVRS